MKRFLIILLLIPSLAFGTYTEFYCQNGGSNLNAGSTNNNTAVYTSTSGNWVQSTRVFTPTDGVTTSSTVSVGMFASVYLNAASVGVYIGRVSAVGAGVNGTITIDSAANIGAAPSNSTGGITVKVGGAWLGPNAASGFPFTLTGWGVNTDSTLHKVRANLKNDRTYSTTATFAIDTSGVSTVIQGYSSTVGDGGRATFDGGTSTGQILSGTGVTGNFFADLIFKTSITTGTSTLVVEANQAVVWFRCVFTGGRATALSMQTGSSAIECEFYGNNTSNTATTAACTAASARIVRSVFHDNTGSNTYGLKLTSNNRTIVSECIFDTNGKYGISVEPTNLAGMNVISQSEFYNNGSDAINIASGYTDSIFIENCNFIKNTGAGINNAAVIIAGYVFNCGYGAGTQANGSADTTNNLTVAGAITYGSNLTPWIDPANGDFSINLAAAQGAGRGAFTETAASYAGTVGYPDIGAAQATPGCTFPTPTATPTSTATPTPSATNTPTPTPTATFTPTITPCAPTPTATATWTPTPTFTPTSTPTNTPTPTATATSTPTPTPTPSATSTPTATACAGGEVSYNHSD